MDLEEIGIKAGNWVDSAQDRDYWRALVNAALFYKPWSQLNLFIYTGVCRPTSPHILRYVDKSNIDRVDLHMPIDRVVRHSVDVALQSEKRINLMLEQVNVK